MERVAAQGGAEPSWKAAKVRQRFGVWICWYVGLVPSHPTRCVEWAPHGGVVNTR